MKTWLLFDCDYLCHRAFYSMGGLNFRGALTGVVFGFLRDVVRLCDQLQTRDIVFAWDHGQSLRQLVYPAYKAKRHQQTMEPAAADNCSAFRQQMADLKFRYLPGLGWKNNLYAKGYEADDVLASVCAGLGSSEEAIIVSADRDLWQLLSRKVRCYNPQSKELSTELSFLRKWGISPASWPGVKALAGCNTDEIKGMRGVGEITAAKYIAGKLNTETPTWKRIDAEGHSWIQRNWPLVYLPYAGCPSFTLQDDCLDQGAWERLADNLGMKSLRDLFPGRSPAKL